MIIVLVSQRHSFIKGTICRPVVRSRRSDKFFKKICLDVKNWKTSVRWSRGYRLDEVGSVNSCVYTCRYTRLLVCLSINRKSTFHMVKFTFSTWVLFNTVFNLLSLYSIQNYEVLWFISEISWKDTLWK